MRKETLLAIVITMLITACGEAPRGNADGADAQVKIIQTSPSQQLETIYDEFFEELMQFDPLFATSLGKQQYNDQLPNFLSSEYREKKRRFEQKYLDRINAIDPVSLPDSALIDYKIFKRRREMAVRSFRFPSHLLPIDPFQNFATRFAALGSGSSVQPFETYSDYQNWANRLEQIPVIFNQAQQNMQMGVEQGVVYPRVLTEQVISQVKAQIVEQVENSVFWQPIEQLPESLDSGQQQQITQRYRKLLEDTVIPAYQQLAHYLADEYLTHSRTETFGLEQLPEGKAWYQYLIEANTSTRLTAAEIHRIGKSEVHRLRAQMSKLMKQMNFEGDLSAFFEEMTYDPRFNYDSRENMPEGLPLFRQFAREPVYRKGWGLYAESLGDEMGLYQGSDSSFQALAAELWRSVQLVTDTGIHGKGWSHQQVLDYMQQNAPVTKAHAGSETKRLMAQPGQALAYKVGQLKIAELRREAERKLGERFDSEAFHQVVLEQGAIPLALLEQKVKRWIIERRY